MNKGSTGASLELPELRADLQIVSSGDGIVIFDALRQRYFRLDETAAQLLAIWPQSVDASGLIALANRKFASNITLGQIDTLKTFLLQSQLAVTRKDEDWHRLAQAARSTRQGWLGWAAHNYLFLKVPLLRPQRMLKWLVPYLSFVFSKAFAVLIAALGAIGLYLVSRQWSEFLGTFSHMMTLNGAIGFAIALAVVKSLHELGHAIVAVRYGCRVPAMGVCFMILVPMLYTDVSDAWRLEDRRKRLAIDCAGLVVETAIACLATFAWAFLPDGVERSIAFALATTSWFLTLALNLNPFMRFDGYYILSDWCGIENLQTRAFDLGRWQLREVLFGLGRSPPERFAPRVQRWLILYAWATWLYRLLLFVGIALLVYGIGFKLLGIVLFLIEIVYFVVGPAWAEITEWWKMRSAIQAARRGAKLALLLAVILAGLFIPLSSVVTAPAVLEDRELAMVFPPRAARLVGTTARQGETVEIGAPLATLESPELERDLRLTALRIKLATLRLARTAGDRQERSETIVLEQSLAALKSRLAGLTKEKQELRLVAPLAGKLAEVPPDFHEGRWLQRTEQVALIAGGRSCWVQGYVSEDDIARIERGSDARFVPDVVMSSRRELKVETIAPFGSPALLLTELASPYGGAIPARQISRPGESRELVPVVGQFLIGGRLTGADASAPCGLAQTVRGTLLIDGRAESFAARFWRRFLKVLVRESGF
jgi:putative peptide zinc metalloprotease protein